MAEPLSVYQQQFAAASPALPGTAPWVRRLRTEALEALLARGLPAPREEGWRYTDLRPVLRRNLAPVTQAGAVAPAQLAPHFLPQAHRLVFVDGRFASALSSVGELPRGARLADLAASLDDEPVAAQLARELPAARDGFAALSAAFFAGGAYLHLARGVALERPVQLLFAATAPAAVYPRNLILLEEGAEAVLVESYVSLTGEHQTTPVSEITLAARARLEHYRLGRESEQAFHLANVQVRAGRDARYVSHFVSLGARVARHEIGVVLDGEGAECELNGLYVAAGRQRVDNETRIDHAKPRGTSRECYKGVLDGHARGAFTGRVVVHPDAQHTDAQQTNNNLLLSEHAEADSRPQLEIYADDVKCSHGATVGQLDETALFYLRSRAIDEPFARSLLVYAFAHDILNRMHLPAVLTELEQQLTGRLLGGQRLEVA